MSNKTFIDKIAHDMPDKEKSYGNLIWYPQEQTLYSYGRHYPLLTFTATGISILNTNGYSQTTRKHINLASAYADYQAYFPDNWHAGDWKALADFNLRALQLRQNELTMLRRTGTKREERLKETCTNLETVYNFLLTLK